MIVGPDDAPPELFETLNATPAPDHAGIGDTFDGLEFARPAEGA